MRQALNRWYRFLNKNLARKITILFVPIFSLILITAFGLVYTIFSQKLVGRVLYDTQLTIEKIKDNLDFYLNDSKTALVTLAGTPALKRMVSFTPENVSYYEMIEDERQVMNVLNNITTFKTYLGNVLVFGKNNVSLDMLQSARKDYDLESAAWAEGLATGKSSGIQFLMPHETDYYTDLSRPYKSALSAVLPVTGSTREITGYVMCEISTERIDNLLSNLTFVKESRVYLLNMEGDQAYQQGGITVSLENAGFSHDYFQDQTGYQIDDKDLVVYTTAGNGWKIAVVSPYDQIVAPATNVMNICIAALVVSVFLTVLLSVVIARRVKKPLDELVTRISQVENRDFTVMKPVNQYGEIGVIRKKFESMIGQIDRLINEVYLGNLRQKEMEYENLINQINPHFMYNVMQLIQTEAVLSDNEVINDIVVRLSGLMRYTMDNSQTAVALWQEYEYTENYLELYRKRFSNFFTYRIDLDERLRDYQVLKFQLQPIVENSIRHGMKNRKNGGEIRISIYRLENRIIFEVYDNGQGMSPQRLAEVRENLENTGATGSIGLQNTHQRVRLRYGSPYGIELESEYGSYTRVVCTIPYEENHHV